MPVAIRRPIAVGSDRGCARLPDPAKVVRKLPIAVLIEFFRAPDVFVEIFSIVFAALRELVVALVYPIVNRIAWGGGE
jgi:hypothetical protein